MTTHEDLQRSLGSYVMGALDPAERAEVEAHLPGCAACARELASYAGLPGLLSRLTIDEATRGPVMPGPSLLPRVLAAVEDERRQRRRRLGGWRAAAGALAVVAVAVAALAVAPDVVDTDREQRRLVAAAGLEASGVLVLDPRPWGTSVRLRIQDLPPASSYVAWATDDTGARTVVATWGRTTSGDVDVTGATSVTLPALASVSVSTGDGRDLLTL